MISSHSSPRSSAFTLVELMVAMSVFALLMTGLVRVWSALSFTGLNTTAYSVRQNDQMRILDYLKRDLRRATSVEIYNGATLVTGTTTFGTELRLILPDYYSDTREEDNANGAKSTHAPSASGSTVSYGTPLTLRYYTLNGATVREEAGVLRTIAAAAGSFSLSFKRETSGAIRSRVLFDQPMRGGAARTLRRQVETLCVPRFAFQS